MPKVPYPYEVNGKLVTGNGSLIPICSLSNRSLLPSLTVVTSLQYDFFYHTSLHMICQIFPALRSFFFPNFPCPTFIQGPTFIFFAKFSRPYVYSLPYVYSGLQSNEICQWEIPIEVHSELLTKLCELICSKLKSILGKKLVIKIGENMW